MEDTVIPPLEIYTTNPDDIRRELIDRRNRDFGTPIPADSVTKLDDMDKMERLTSNTLLPISFLTKGAEVQRQVCKVFVPKKDGIATAFLVAPDILMTNNHVFDDHESIGGAHALFGYNAVGDERTGMYIDIIELIMTDVDLDFSLVRLKDPMPTYFQLPGAGQTKYALNQAANIIGHPLGRPKEISLRNNIISGIYTNSITYSSDTDRGSSGSPVLDNSWRVIALHSRAGDMKDGVWISNRGFRIDAIVTKIKKQFPRNSAVFKALFIPAEMAPDAPSPQEIVSKIPRDSIRSGITVYNATTTALRSGLVAN
eukprot:TRINITY_DN171_c0_g1_i2.p1 TRINITY_DN171_c0_g1~~TRINITY_DN171_c0_g1_i2.p1  ORF type:complete len:313 (-),score=53.32 TRINITY_DN171_c0_g1_i2:253-1191(-)